MAFDQEGFAITMEADVTLDEKIYVAVQADPDTEMAGLADDGGHAIGILQTAPSHVGEAVRVMITGRSKMYAGDDVLKYALLAADAHGKGVTAGQGDYVVAMALAAGAADEIIPVLLMTSPIPLA